MKPSSNGKRRIFELDLLRGLFIIIILIDHLQFWPSPFKYITGEGRLWVSAAEGFFLISGLLIGYIRAYKGAKIPLKVLTKKLAARALMLYIWGVAITFFIVCFTLLVGNHPLLPKLPDAQQLSSPLTLTWSILSSNYFSDWIYFLRLYAIMLLTTPIFLWLLRRGYEKFIVPGILGLYLFSFFHPEAGLQWQVYFFGAALIGYHLETIATWLRTHLTFKYVASGIIISFTLLTMVLSYYFVHGWELVEGGRWFMDRQTYVDIRTIIDPWFSSNPIMPGRIILAFIWFSGILLLFHYLKAPILRWLGWLLMPLGERSLSGYILQALVLPFVVVLIPVSSNSWINAIITIVVILGMWLLLNSKLIQKLIPR